MRIMANYAHAVIFVIFHNAVHLSAASRCVERHRRASFFKMVGQAPPYRYRRKHVIIKLIHIVTNSINPQNLVCLQQNNYNNTPQPRPPPSPVI